MTSDPLDETFATGRELDQAATVVGVKIGEPRLRFQATWKLTRRNSPQTLSNGGRIMAKKKAAKKAAPKKAAKKAAKKK